MAVTIDIREEAGDWSGLGDLDVLCSQALMAALKIVDAQGEVAVLFTDDAQIQAINAQYRGKDKPTDVLSFPGQPQLDGHVGDIAISHGVSSRDAAAQGKTLKAHITHLLIHGYFHLMGFDHMEDTAAVEMMDMERRALASLGISDPYAES